MSSKKEKEDTIKVVDSNKIWNYNKNWKEEIISKIKKDKIDIIHIHGVWMYPQFIAAKICVRNGIPFVFTPHGMY